METKKPVSWLIEFRLPEGTCWAEEWQVGDDTRLGISADKKTATRYDSAEIAGRFAVEFKGRLMRHAYVVADKEDNDG